MVFLLVMCSCRCRSVVSLMTVSFFLSIFIMPLWWWWWLLIDNSFINSLIKINIVNYYSDETDNGNNSIMMMMMIQMIIQMRYYSMKHWHAVFPIWKRAFEWVACDLNLNRCPSPGGVGPSQPARPGGALVVMGGEVSVMAWRQVECMGMELGGVGGCAGDSLVGWWHCIEWQVTQLPNLALHCSFKTGSQTPGMTQPAQPTTPNPQQTSRPWWVTVMGRLGNCSTFLFRWLKLLWLGDDVWWQWYHSVCCWKLNSGDCVSRQW